VDDGRVEDQREEKRAEGRGVEQTKLILYDKTHTHPALAPHPSKGFTNPSLAAL
jgi:hypothetical protein